ncbi:unnamed protein product [Lymnaea stagnalis]|uniref:Tubulin polyglutamylase complex subunit 2 n=1 Tax=Lymnaea stagnalis TaxID=6523 RepID=A0AAV2GXB9_LYMST
MDDIKPYSYLDQLTFNIISYLEKKPGICQVKNEVKAPAERPAVHLWEQKQSLLLPDDLKNFYLTSNGFHLSWSVKMDNLTIPVGNMNINPLSQLTPLDAASDEGAHLTPSLWDLNMEKEVKGRKLPNFTSSKIFQLDGCQGYGKVCLVYNESQNGESQHENDDEVESGVMMSTSDFVTELWFLDRSLRWHYMCPSFQAYYRLMLMHLGLPHWQFAFTDIGLPPISKQWFNMFAPIRLELDIEGAVNVPSEHNTTGKGMSSPLDLNKVFKGKNDRKKLPPTQAGSGTAVPKKKPPVTSARSASSLGKQVAPSSSQINVKSNK